MPSRRLPFPNFVSRLLLRSRLSAGWRPRHPATPRTAPRPAAKAASDAGRQAVRRSPRGFPSVRNIERHPNLNDNNLDNKRDFIIWDEQYSPIIAGIAAARDPSADRVARIRARRDAIEFPPSRARSGAQPIGDQPSNTRIGGAVRREAFCSRRALGAVDRRRRALSREGLSGAGGAAGGRPGHAAASARQRRRALDQRLALFHQHGTALGVAGLQATQSRTG